MDDCLIIFGFISAYELHREIGSEVGHGCITLMISLLYGKRALPITWLVVKGCKGHLSELNRSFWSPISTCRMPSVIGTKKRFRIETFFSDEKSRGFHLHKSHLSDPERLGTLMIAACLAYLWIIYLGLTAIREDWVRLIHRTDRCDWSLFHLGWLYSIFPQ
jgi:hypothetical protein